MTKELADHEKIKLSIRLIFAILISMDFNEDKVNEIFNSITISLTSESPGKQAQSKKFCNDILALMKKEKNRTIN